jgi:hypothetical protein
MAIATTNLLGLGIYTPAEAAMYARVRTQTVNRWFYGSKIGSSVVSPERGGESKDVSFLDFVQILAIRAIRREHGVSLQKIRSAVEYAKKHYKVSHPLAMEHTTYLYIRKPSKLNEKNESGGNETEDDNLYELIISLPKKDDHALVELTGKKAGNQMIREVIELFLKDVSFGAGGLAKEYCAWKWQGLEVKMNPKRHFGEPLLPSGYSASALWDAVRIEGGIDAASRAYGIDRMEVELACSYLDFLQGASAA